MIRIFPRLKQLETLKNPLPEELITFSKYLDKNLKPDWNIYVEPYIGGFAHADVIIAHPERGCMIINMVNWEDLSSYELRPIKVESSRVSRTEKHILYKGGKKVSHPVKVIKEKRDILVKEYLVDINNHFSQQVRNKFKAFRLGLYFHKVADSKDLEHHNKVKSTTAWDFDANLFGNDYVVNNLDFATIIDKHDDKKKLTLNSDIWKADWHNYIKTKLVPPYHKIEHGTVIKLTNEQERHVAPAPNVHQRLKGVAGSGKTLVIAQRAARIAANQQSVLIVSFNITLHHYIKKQVERAAVGFDPTLITYMHFHKVCWDFADSHGFDFSDKYISKKDDEFISSPKEDEGKYYSSTVPERVIKEITNNGLKPRKYDAIIIDEGQDFQHNWYKMLELFLTNNNELLLVVDDKQNIYNKDLSWIYDGMQDVQFRGTWRTLSISHRLPKAFIPVIKHFGTSYLDADKDEDLSSGVTQSFPFMKPSIKWLESSKISFIDKPKNQKDKNFCLDCNKALLEENTSENSDRCIDCQIHFNKCCENIHLAYKEILKKGNQIDDIVILVPTNSEGKEITTYFKNKHIDVMGTFTRNTKLTFSLIDDNKLLRITTIHSFKGWEMTNVIILSALDKMEDDKTDLLMYTALTRTLNSLFIINRLTKYISFGKYLKTFQAVE